MNLIRSSLKILLARIFSSLLSFSAVVIFSRELGASPLGTYYPFIALIGIFSIPADFGMRSAIEKRLSEGDDPSQYLGTAIAVKVVPLFLVGILVLLADNYVAQYLGADLAILLVVVLLVQEWAKMSLHVLRGELRVGETAAIQVLRPLGWITIGYVLFRYGYGVRGIIYGYLAGTIAMFILGWWKVSTPLSRPTLHHARSLFEYGRFSVISAVGGYFYSWMDVAILTLFVSTGITATRGGIGAYENAWRISVFALMFSKAIATTIFPQFSKWDAENATDRIEAIIPKAILPALLIVVPAFVGTVVLAKDILGILFSQEFTVAWLALIILMGEKILQAFHVVFGRSLQAIDRPDLAAYATVVSVVVNLVLNLVLIWQFDLVGAALATAISFAVNTGLHLNYLRQFITIEFPVREAVWSVFASIGMGFAVYFVHTNTLVQDLVGLLIIIVFGMIVYAILISLYAPIRQQVSDILGSSLKTWFFWP